MTSDNRTVTTAFQCTTTQRNSWSHVTLEPDRTEW